MPFKPISILFICFLFLAPKTRGQNKVVLEEIQTYSNILPNAQYWRLNAQNSAAIITALDNHLFADLSMERQKEIEPAYTTLSKISQLGKIIVNWQQTAHIPYHAYLEVYEMEPNLAYRNNLLDIAENQKDSIHSIWFITCTILDQQKKIYFKRSALMSLIPTNSIGIGHTTNYSLSTTNNIHTALAKAVSQINPLKSDYTYIETHAPALYATDNFMMPFVHMAARIPIDTNKNFLAFNYKQQIALLRIPTASMQKINLKDKNNSDELVQLIGLVKNKPNWGRSELYRVVQPLRDVKNNIDYSIETFMSFNPNPTYDVNPLNLIQFVDDSLNKIYKDSVLIGSFKVKENIPIKDKWINPNILYNGYDSTEKIDLGTSYKKIPVIVEKQIQGKFYDTDFTIYITNQGTLKSILVQDQWVLVTQGKQLPTQVIMNSNQNISEAFLNFILVFSNSEIFQTPSNN